MIMTSSAWTGETPVSQKEIELERQRLQLERERFELEKERFQLEKQKRQLAQSPREKREPVPVSPQPVPLKEHYTYDLYLGLDYMSAYSSERRTTVNGIEEENEASSRGYGFQLGFGTFDEDRVELAFSRLLLNLDGEKTEWDVSMLSLDYLFVYHEAFGPHLSPLLKVGLAAARSDNLNETLRAMGYGVNGDDKIEGMGIRLGFGVSYLLDQRMELSLGYDSTSITWNDTTLTYPGGSDKLELHDSIGVIYLTLDYRF